MRSRSCTPLRFALLLGLLAASAAADPAPVLSLFKDEPDGCEVAVEIGALQIEDLEIAGQTWQALSLPGGELHGEPGEPGLPTCSGLLVVPPGREVTVTGTIRASEKRTGLHPLPVQSEDATDFVWNKAVYAGDSGPTPVVTLGPAAIMHGIRVVPFTVHPVQYDAASGEVTVATAVDLDFAYQPSGDAEAGKAASGGRLIGESFAQLLAGSAVNWPRLRDEVVSGPGTWLCICDSDAGVAAAIAPLADWRRRQGYNVIVVNTQQTGATTTLIKSYIQNVYDTVEPPLEYICLVGDAGGTISVPCWRESYSGYNGETDHFYTTLEGGDQLADAHVGRLTCRSVAELQTIVGKIVGYETAPPTSDPGWFTRATVTGDPNDSGMTVVYVAKWVKSHLSRLGYTQIDTIWTAPFASRMFASCNQGVSAFAYRGFYGVSGFSVGYIDALTNGGELPFAVFPTCGSGSFATETSAPPEAFLRNANGGAIGAIGTATLGTHTRYNNCYFGGVWEGALNSGDRHLGAAHTRGKLELYRQYAENEPNIPVIWSSWNNLMGDPATEMWQALPAVLTVVHPAQLPVGASALPVAVNRSGEPVAGARVAAFKDGEIRAVGTTDAAGQVVLPLPAHTAGSLLITVTGHDLRPYQGSLVLGSVDAFAAAQEWTLDDTLAGNGDGLASPGETLSVMIALRNLGGQMAGAVTAAMLSEDALTVADPAVVSCGDIPAGEVVWSGPFTVHVQANAPDAAAAVLRISATSGSQTWISRITLPLTAAAPVVTGAVWSLGDPAAGQTGQLTVTLRNDGSRPATSAAATLSPQSPYLLLAGPATAAVGALPIGGTATAVFTLKIRDDCYGGYLGVMDLELVTAEGSAHDLVTTLSIGSASVYSPTGPDAYGYLALDNLDHHPDAPVYQWVELNPAFGGPGQDVGLTDFGYEQDDTRTVDLPFSFRYYGQDFQQISICSNGWASLGASSLCESFNWSLPCPDVPRPLLAVFWDDLKQSGNNRVYHWYDAANGRYIMHWSRMTNDINGMNNCEIVLYDPLVHPTLTGDGLIVYQYANVSNSDSERGYCTTGIQNPDGTDGITWTYYNNYARTSRVLQNGRAIAFVPTLRLPAAAAAVAPQTLDFTVPTGESDSAVLTITGAGEAGTFLSFSLATAETPAPAWLAFDPPTGQVPSGQDLPVTIAVDAVALPDGVYTAALIVQHNAGDPLVVPIRMTVGAPTNVSDQIPAILALAPVFPNPFNPRCEINFSLPAPAATSLAVHDLAGRRVAVLVQEQLAAGTHRLVWDGTDLDGRRLASGTYLLRLEAAGEVRCRKLVLVK